MGTPGIPRALLRVARALLLGERFRHSSGTWRRESAEVCLELAMHRHHPRKRMIQYSKEPAIEPRARRVLDTPLSWSMTALLEQRR